jgi:predicted amidohydrolase
MHIGRSSRRSFIKTAALAGAGAMAVNTGNSYASYKGEADFDDLTIAVLQIYNDQPTVEGNVRKIVDRVLKTSEKGVNLMVSAELQISIGPYSKEEAKKAIQTIPGPASEMVAAASKKANAYVIFGLIEKDGDDLYNSLAITGPKGDLVAKYRKVHLFRSEQKRFKYGDKLCIFDTEFGRIGATICYDIMYPEYFRAIAAQPVGVIAHSTAMNSDEITDTFGWGTSMYQTLVRTRSFENQVYIPSSNVCGVFDSRYYFANSCIYTPWGTPAGALGHAEGTLITRTEFKRLKEWQKIASYWNDRRPEIYKQIQDY